MKRLLSAAACIALLSVVSELEAAEYKVYLLLGQSNMEGYGYISDLPAADRGAVPRTRVYCGTPREDGQSDDGLGVWSQLTPGFGTGFRSDGRTNFISGRFGPELSFARRLGSLRPDEPIAIIKYTKGGSSLDARAGQPWGTWDPDDASDSDGNTGLNQYDHALATLRMAAQSYDIDGDGQPDTLTPAGIVWMQGETDATQQDTADAYAMNLAKIIELFRAAMRDDDLPFILGRISDRGSRTDTELVWTHGEIVRRAQEQVASTDPNVTLVTTTDNYDYSDPYHYDSVGYLDLGRKFAEAMHALLPSDKSE